MASPMPDFDPDTLSLSYPPHWSELAAAEQELRRQAELWGEQNHPLIPCVTDLGEPADSVRARYEDGANRWKEYNDRSVRYDRLGWHGILLEEVFELLSEEDPDKQYTEAIQVAAVALNIAGSIRRKKAKEAA